MSNIPDELKYTKEHEWIRLDDDLCVIGITDFAQSELGDIVFVELPEEEARLSVGDPFGVVESVKTVSDLYSPLNGEVVEINHELEDAPESVNQSPYDEGWMVKIRPDDPADIEKLLDATGYSATL